MSDGQTVPAGTEEPPALPAEVRRLVWGWMVAACVVAALAGALLPWPAAVELRDEGVIAVVLVVLALAANQLQLRVRHGQVMETFQLDEAIVAAAFLLLQPMFAIAVVVVGVVVHQVIDQRQPIKIVFNVATVAVGTALGVGAGYLVTGPVGTDIGWLAMVGAFLAALGYMAVNQFAIATLVAKLERRPIAGIVRQRVGLSLFVAASGASVGIPFAVLWRVEPLLSPAILLPVIIVAAAYRVVVEQRPDMAVLASERDRLDRLVAGASDGIVLLDEQARVEVWNAAMERITGTSEAEAIGQPLDELIVASTPAGVEIAPSAPMFRATWTDAFAEQELVIAGADGGVRVVQIRHSVLFDGRRRLVGDVILFHDVTREREIEGIKEDLIARVSHELRTPLTPILGFAQVLRARGEELAPDQRREYAATIERQATGLWQLIGGLIAAQEVEAGARAGTPVPVEVSALLTRLADRAGDDVEARTDGPVHVLADPEHLEEAISSLLVNAVRYGAPPVVLEAHEQGGEVRVRVRDHGPGVDAGFVPHLFERFSQASTGTTRHASGLGLGLYLVKVRVGAYGGRVWYEENRPTGACFTIALPVADRQRQRV